MPTDSSSSLLQRFPRKHSGGVLVGITPGGLAAYHENDSVYLAELVGGEVKTPPSGYGLVHSLDLAAFEWTIGEYVIQVADEDGPWRALSDYARERVDQINEDPDTLVKQ